MNHSKRTVRVKEGWRRGSGPLAVLLLALATAACSDPPPEPAAGSGTEASGPQRVLALAPSVAELVFALGEGDRVVGVGDYVQYPPEATELPRLGGLMDPHLEEMVALAPDLAILLPSEDATRRHLEELGIAVLTIRQEVLADVPQAAQTVARRLEVPAAGDEFVANWDRQLAPSRETLASARDSQRPVRVFLSVGRTPGELASILSSGSGGFLPELIEVVGAANVLTDTGLPYPQVGLEEVLLRSPELILELQGEVISDERRALLVSDWSEYPQIPAVEQGCVVVVAGDFVLVPGPRLPRLAEAMREALAACRSKARAA